MRLYGAFVAGFVFVAFVAFLLVFVGDFVELQRRFSNESVTRTCLLALLRGPSFLMKLWPFLVGLSVALVLLHMLRHNEITVLRSFGVSAVKLTTPLLLMAFLIGLIGLFLWHPFSVFLMRRYQTLIASPAEIEKKETLRMFKSGLWIRQKIPGGHLILHHQGVDMRMKELKDVSISFFVGGARLKRTLFAEKCAVLPEGLFLEKLQTFTVNRGHRIFKRRFLPIKINIKALFTQAFKPGLLYMWSFPNVGFLMKSGADLSRPYRFQFHSLLVSVFQSFAFASFVCAVLLGIPKKRASWGVFLLIILIAFILHFLAEILGALGQSGLLGGVFSLWIPGLVLLMLSFSLMHFSEEALSALS